MTRIFMTAVMLMLMSMNNASAENRKDPVVPYKCTNRSGEVGVGTGRLSLEGEYSPFLKRAVRAGEYVVFKYSNETREYWFKPSHCTKV